MNRSDAGKKGSQRRHNEAVKRYLNNPSVCLNCNEVIPYEKRSNRFCNQSCAASYNNRGVVRVETVNPIMCANCGRVKETRQNKYCDECIANGVYTGKITNLEDAQAVQVVKRIVIEQRGHRCEGCGLSEWRGQEIPIDLHHIDGNSDNNTDENLQLLCPNCHAQTETYKGANAGGNSSSRQKMRRKRYREGKTY